MVPPAIDTLWYVSARARDNGRDMRRLADSLEYGLVIRRAARGGDIVKRGGDSLTRDGDVTPIDSVRLTASAFASALRSRAESRDDSLTVLYVHGFGTSLHEAWEHAAQSSVRSRSSAPWVVFCWPSNGSGVAWPRAELPLTRRIVVYASSVDRLLALSRRVNHSERAGLIRAATQSHAGVEIVNVTNGFAAEDRLRRVFGSHHSLPRASAALFDLLQIVARRFPAECRATLGTARRESEGVWRMTVMRPPEPDAVSGCAR